MNLSNITWKKLSEKHQRIGYRNIYRKNFQMPDGTIAEWTTVEKGQAINVLALTPDFKVIAAVEFRPGPEKICYELPGGMVDSGEEPLQAARRELLEETGYTSSEITLLASTPITPYTGWTRFHFLATNCAYKQPPRASEENEFIKVELLEIDDYLQKLYDCQVTAPETALFGLRELEKRRLSVP